LVVLGWLSLICWSGDLNSHQAFKWLKAANRISVDIETYGVAKLKGERKKLALSFVHGKVRLLQLSDGETTYIIDAALLRPGTVAIILEALRGKTLILHGGVFDLPRLKRHYGVDLMDEDLVDTMVLSRLTRSGELKDDGKPVEHSLRAVLRKEKVANIGKDTDHEWQEPLNPERLGYAIDDARHLPALADALMAVVADRQQQRGLKLFMPAYREYMQMQYRGVPLDLKRFNALLEKYSSRAKDALSRVEELAPEHPGEEEWSWGNKLKPGATDKYGNNTGRNGALRALQLVGIKIKSLKKEARAEYLRKHPEAKLLEALDEYYRYSDLHSDAKGWLTYSVEGDRLYPNINPFSQVTCRSAYSDPALQNTPKEPDEEGALSLRDCIRAADAYKIIAADYAAQELRIVAHIADDEDLIKAFTSEAGDPHLQIAEKIAGKKLKRGTTEGEHYRKLGKSVNFGFTYGQGAARFQQSVYQKTSERIFEEQAKAYQKAFQDTWRGVYQWQKKFGSRSGKKPEHWYTESFIGRRRYVSRKWDTELPGWKPAYTDRLNGPIQSGGADMLYTAMQMLREDQENGKLQNVSILLTTHDEIALEAPEDVAEDAKVWLKTRMRDAAKQFLREELTKEDCVEGEVGDSWGGN
jgi:DNA polymerase I-like protein with 3'-5' exonuclease and polymerase domains